MRAILIVCLLTAAAMATVASAQQLHIDTPIGDLHVGQRRGFEGSYREQPSYPSTSESDREGYYHHHHPRYQPVCRQIQYHDHHGNHRIREVCD